MKIGIVTFHRALNYGAVLQACAMRRIFSDHGEVEMVDYWPDYHSSHYSLLDTRFLNKNQSLSSRVRLLKSAIKRIILLPVRLKRNKKFLSFIDSNIVKVSNAPIKLANKIPDYFDVVVYGSDQIWRVYDFDNYPRPDMVYMGAGVLDGTRKIAFAASMGDVNVDTLCDDSVIKALKNFEHINVREQALSESLLKHSGLSSCVVLDPTFLVSSDVWKRMAETIPRNRKDNKYALFYSLIPSEESIRIAKNIAEEKGVELVEINGFETIGGLFNKSVAQSAGPLDFLELIMNAEFIVSTSFHGVVFSIIFEKQFCACGMKGHSERVRSLLSKLSIEDRLIDTVEQLESLGEIDYKEVTKLLAREIEHSKELLEYSLFE